jgi:hypothetical protein
LITYPVPTAETLALGGRAKSIMAYRNGTEVELADGTEVRPTLRTAKSIIEGALAGITIPVIVTEGSYRVIDREGEARSAAADKLKWERFDMFMAQDGITENPRREEGRCFDCGAAGLGSMHRAPDAMGYPTEVLFVSDCCDKS